MASINGLVEAYNASGSPETRTGNPYEETTQLFDALTRDRMDVHPSSEHRQGNGFLPDAGYAPNGSSGNSIYHENTFFRAIPVGAHAVRGAAAWVVAQPRVSIIGINQPSLDAGYSEDELGKVDSYALEFFAVPGDLQAVEESLYALPNDDAESAFIGSVELDVPTDGNEMILGNEMAAVQGFNHLLREVMEHAGIAASIEATA